MLYHKIYSTIYIKHTHILYWSQLLEQTTTNNHTCNKLYHVYIGGFHCWSFQGDKVRWQQALLPQTHSNLLQLLYQVDAAFSCI